MLGGNLIGKSTNKGEHTSQRRI